MSRTLLFLFDGTDSDPTIAAGAEPTNVFRLNSLVAETGRKDRKIVSQVTFYLPGIGTKFYVESYFNRIRQLIFGLGVDSQVMRAYINLVSNYRENDSLVVIGFSRGAIAARLFARLVADFGILRAKNIKLFEEQLDLFGSAILENYNGYIERVGSYRERMSGVLHPPTTVQFLGLFDCVYGPYDVDYSNFLTEIDDSASGGVRRFLHLMSLHDVRKHFLLSRLKSPNGNGREVWMPGVHSDVGGGYLSDFIANVSLLTMAEAMHDQVGVALDVEEVENLKRRINAPSSISINRETLVGAKKDRNDMISSGDLIHSLHKYLVQKQVTWKGTAETYQDKFKGRLKTDRQSAKVMKSVSG
jgi:uncharacterized protein (DUF2235 family)